MNADKPRIGVSRCLLGDRVRYDGDSKPCHILIDDLASQFELIPICPEVEAGLGTPRPPVQLTGDADAPRMTGRDASSLDVTGSIHSFCDTRLPELDHLDGYICKSRSPSCGHNTTPRFMDGACVSETEDGLFIRRLRLLYPELPIIDEDGIGDDHRRASFIIKVNAHRKQQ